MCVVIQLYTIRYVRKRKGKTRNVYKTKSWSESHDTVQEKVVQINQNILLTFKQRNSKNV